MNEDVHRYRLEAEKYKEDLTLPNNVKSTVKILSIFVAFSKNVNFTTPDYVNGYM